MLLAAALVFSACGGREDSTSETDLSSGNEITPGTERPDSGENGSGAEGAESVGGGGSTENGSTSGSISEPFSLPAAISEQAKQEYGQATDQERRAVRSEGNVRRLQKVFGRMAEGGEVTVAYLGGSITEGYLVNSKQNYAYKTTDWLKELFANDNIRRVNAGLSGTSSTIGLLRVQKDVLDEKPDLVFIEFAVNDANDITSKLMYESLVNRIVNSETAPAVVLIFTVLENGYTCEEHQAKVGEAYGLPMISVNAALSPEMESGALVWSDYAQDEAHPNNQGHTMISNYIRCLFTGIMTKQTLDSERDYSACREYGAPYAGMNFYNSENLYIPDTGGFIEANSNISHFPHDWLWGQKAGSSLKFTMTGKNLFLLYKEADSMNMGALEVYVDGKRRMTVNANAADGWNNPEVCLLLDGPEEQEHEIELVMAEDSQEKDFHILGFGTTGEIRSAERVNEEDIPYLERAVVNTGNTYALQELMKRAEAGEELTIGFIGGSITQGAGASNADKCYARLVFDWWSRTYPQASFRYVNAGIGATTSQFACARVKDDLLSQEPDFVIVEFSVNDSAGGFYAETYESLLNLLLRSEAAPAVMVLNMVQYDNGINAQAIHNEAAKRYGLPIVSMKDSIYSEIRFGRLTAAELSEDMLHPNDRGHAYGAEIVTAFLQKVKDGVYHSDAPAGLPSLPDGLISLTSVRLDSRNADPVLNGFTKDTAVQNGVADTFKNGYTAREEGASIRFENVFGSRIALQYRKTNSLGAPFAVAVIDGNEAEAVKLDGNFPDGWGNWLYLHSIADGLDPSVPHTVEIRITQGAAKDFYLVSVIASGQKTAE